MPLPMLTVRLDVLLGSGMLVTHGSAGMVTRGNPSNNGSRPNRP